jgi:hypothetical protein
MRIEVYKLRLPNPDTRRGKSGGYRVIYSVAIERRLAVILTLYFKKEKATITDAEVRSLVNSAIYKYIIGGEDDTEGDVE